MERGSFKVEVQPGPCTRSGTSVGSVLWSPRGSPPSSRVNGAPEDAWNVPPNCHPAAMAVSALFRGAGRDQVKCNDKVCPTLKSEGPRFSRASNHGRLLMEFEN